MHFFQFGAAVVDLRMKVVVVGVTVPICLRCNRICLSAAIVACAIVEKEYSKVVR